MTTLITNAHVGLPDTVPINRAQRFIPIKAIWDTGGTGTVITKSVVSQLGLVPTGKTEVHGVNSSEIKNTYIVDIGLPNRVRIQNCNVIESEINSPDVQMLIGMDIIQMGDFAIANVNGKTTFSYCIPPHRNPIDLLEKSNRVNPKRKVR